MKTDPYALAWYRKKSTHRNILLVVLALGFGWIFFLSITPVLPHPEAPIQFYSNQTRQDIKLLFCSAIRQAKTSVDIHMYGITDPDLISVLAEKGRQGTCISIEYDKKASSISLLKSLPPSIHVEPSSSKALMHRKILIIDQEIVFLGSANLTPTSLRHHDNLVIGLYCPSLAAYLNAPSSPFFPFTLQERQAELWLLPDDKRCQALRQLIYTLDSAQQSIQIAMFTLTHPLIGEALLSAHHRGVKVEIAVDYYTARGASQKCLKTLSDAGIPILLSRGQELLHHKWALIDERCLIMGSANWTKAAFQKNKDFLLFLPELSSAHISFVKKLWRTIFLESKDQMD